MVEDKIEENIEIEENIDQTMKTVFNKKIKEEIIDLNTEDTGFAVGFTEEINGFLECLVIDTGIKHIQILITLEKYPDVTLFKSSDFQGQKYLLLRNKTIAPTGEMFNFQADKWSLNDGLRVEINGPKGTSAHFVFKYS